MTALREHVSNKVATPELPLVSILIVARNTGQFIGDAIISARQQTFSQIEVIVVDDASTDDTRAVAEHHAAQDARVRVIDGPRAGLAAIRNVSLDAARGRWAAILDSDDMLHPRHIEQLVAAAQRTGAEIVAANMVSFAHEHGLTQTALFADRRDWREERWLSLIDYVRANSASGDAVSAGYLKPLFNLDFLRRQTLRYDLRLRIAEDYDLVARTMAAGARYLYLPMPTYFYRKHSASTSHRQSVADLTGMLLAADSAAKGSDDPALLAAVNARELGIRSALRHVQALDALKQRKLFPALAKLGHDLRAWQLMVQTIVEGGGRRLVRRPLVKEPLSPAVLVVGKPPSGSLQSQEIAQLAADGMTIIFRDVVVDNRARAGLANELPPLAHIFVAPPATLDDAAYAMAPALVRNTGCGMASDTGGASH